MLDHAACAKRKLNVAVLKIWIPLNYGQALLNALALGLREKRLQNLLVMGDYLVLWALMR